MQTQQPQMQQDSNNAGLRANNPFSKVNVVTETYSFIKAVIISFIVFLLSILVLNATAQTVTPFTTSSTWVCPAGITSVKVECWGGGGAGGGTSSIYTYSGGGGGGAYTVNTVAVVPGITYTITTGTGALGGFGNGGNGTASSFVNGATTLVTAPGGIGGTKVNGVSSIVPGLGEGGAGGIGTYNGGNGASGTNSGTKSGGGGGGAGSTANGNSPLAASTQTGGIGGALLGGNGGNGTSGSANGTNGGTYGGGGGGGRRGNVVTNYAGGNGGNGFVRLTFSPSCNTPTAQPTALILSPAVNSINGSFTASSSAFGYLVVMTTTSTAPSTPVNGTTYTVGASALGGTIISTSNATSFIANSLAAPAQYWFWVYAYQAPTACTGTITYLEVSPLTGNETTIACGAPVNTAIITTFSATFNWSALSWSLGHIPTACESVLLVLDRSAATANEGVTVNFDVDFTVHNFTLRNISNTSRRVVFGTGGNKTVVINGNLTIECPGGTISNRFNRCVFNNILNTTINGDLTLGRVSALTATTEGHSGIGSNGSTPNQTYTLYGNMTFNPRGYTTDEWTVFAFNKAGTQYIYNNTRSIYVAGNPSLSDTIQAVLFEDLRIGTTNATTLIMQGSMYDGYMEMQGRAGITIGANSTLDLPANYSLNVIQIPATPPLLSPTKPSHLKMLANSKLRLGGDRSVNDIEGFAHGVAGSNFPNGLTKATSSLDPTSTIEYYGNNTITQTIYNGVTYKNLLATNSVQSDMVAPTFIAGTAHAQKITTGPVISNTSININGFADVTLGNPGSNTFTLQSDGPLNIKTDGGLFCNANVVSGVGAFAMSSGSTLGMGHIQGISAVGNATGNIQMTGGRIYNLTGNYIYNGLVAQVTGAGLPPASTNDLIIDNPTTVTIANNQIVNGVHLLKQGTFDIQTNKITINGVGTMNATSGKMKADFGTVEMKGTSGAAQSLSGNWFVNKTISILTNANTKGITVAALPADTLLIKTALDYNGVIGSTITTNDNLTLLSRFTGTANFGNATGNSIVGKVNVERYMAARSAWRLLATPIQAGTSPTVSQAWREGNAAHTATGYGTRITGPIGTFGAAGTLDDYTVRPSMKSYNSTINDFTGVVDANTTTIANRKGYYVFVRGDRAAAATIGLSGITNLRIKGDLQTGDQSYSILANKFESIGNPYASRIEVSKITKTNIVNAFTIWNPNSVGLYNVGAYETYTWDGTNYTKPGGVIRNYIESGEAFFVQSNSTTVAGNVTIKETDKAVGSANVSRPGVTTPTLEINMYAQNMDGSSYLADGAKINYNNSFSAGVDNLDVRKISNTYDNISIKNGVANLIVERRPHIVDADTIKLNITGMRLAPYRIEIDPSVLTNPNLEGTFVDKYLQTRTAISFTAVTAISFEITADAGSRAVDRFIIVFKELSSTSFNNIAAERATVNKNVKVNWTVQNEVGVTNYSIEHSADGTNFTAVGTQVAVANNGTNQAYSFVDANASTGKNWYRVKVNIGTSIARYTAVAMVNELPAVIVNSTATVGIYPNPVVGGRVNFRLYNQAAGNYQVIISSAAGQVIQRAVIKVQTNAVAQTVNIGAASAGIYYATIIDEKGVKNTMTIMVK